MEEKFEDSLKKHGISAEVIKIEIPVLLMKDSGAFVISTNWESEKIFNGQSLCAQGETLEDAQKKFWNMLTFIMKYDRVRSNELDKYKFFQKGDWKERGGKWFTILGLSLYFRYGKGMKGGKYIPFTKLNISFTNYWEKK